MSYKIKQQHLNNLAILKHNTNVWIRKTLLTDVSFYKKT